MSSENPPGTTTTSGAVTSENVDEATRGATTSVVDHRSRLAGDEHDFVAGYVDEALERSYDVQDGESRIERERELHDLRHLLVNGVEGCERAAALSQSDSGAAGVWRWRRPLCATEVGSRP